MKERDITETMLKTALILYQTIQFLSQSKLKAFDKNKYMYLQASLLLIKNPQALVHT